MRIKSAFWYSKCAFNAHKKRWCATWEAGVELFKTGVSFFTLRCRRASQNNVGRSANVYYGRPLTIISFFEVFIDPIASYECIRLGSVRSMYFPFKMD